MRMSPSPPQPKPRMHGISPRATILFALYYQARELRSLARLREDLGAIGVAVSLTTLKRYSVRFDWQAEVQRLDEAADGREESRSLEQIVAMNERQSQLGRTLQGAAATSLQGLLRDSGRIAEITPAEIARLADTGTKLERLALGEATERQDVITGAWNSIVRDVVELFKTVNDIADRNTRAAAFAHGLDSLVDRQIVQGRR